MISIERSACAVLSPLVASTVIGYVPAVASGGALAVTVIDEVLPALTTALAACACEATAAVTVQPAGPPATTPKVRSSGVSLARLSVNEKLRRGDALELRELGRQRDAARPRSG